MIHVSSECEPAGLISPLIGRDELTKRVNLNRDAGNLGQQLLKSFRERDIRETARWGSSGFSGSLSGYRS